MAGDPTTGELIRIRDQLVRLEFRRFLIGVYALISSGVLASLLFVYALFSAQGKMSWEMFSLFVFVTICFALPLFQKFQFGKDSASFELARPIDTIEKMLVEKSAEADAARAQVFQQTQQQLSNLSVQVAELSDKISQLGAAPVRSKAAAAGKSSANSEGADPEPTIESLRRRLPVVNHEDDPQKERFGGKEEVDGRRLSAEVTPSAIGSKWMTVTMTVAVQNRQPLSGRYAYFFVHDTFQPDVYRVPIDRTGSSATASIQAYGAFTVGVAVDRGKTLLELDLATSPNVEAPNAWRQR